LTICGDDTPEDEGLVPSQTGVIVQLTEGNLDSGKPAASRKHRKTKRPIGFQLGELGHLDEEVKEEG
jgi:hypothetical protein